MLEIQALHKDYQGKRVLDSIHFSIGDGEIVGLIGMSGSGKSTLARCVVGLEKPQAGKMLWNGQSLNDKSVRRKSRRDIQMVFQDPRNSLNPAWTVKRSLLESMRQFHGTRSAAAHEHMMEGLLTSVRLPVDSLHRYPHELSTGQCQRVCLARSLVPEPKLLVLDECLSALDVSIQAQMITLLRDLHQHRQMSYLFISHDIAVVASLCQKIIVIQQGVIVEAADAHTLIHNPRHPYTRSLLADTPTLPEFTYASEEREERSLVL
ncbi:Oligopeptide transport ATP-binding protein OppF [Paenibacillus solanacearum]|uniref:Oligopeptide transport ATP-binding protein OppF n=1 Tax=Paenibacillus solanacearum TaxID=2048548 RepID=A0A916K367_9BACL|nr:ABC transporter ATP-binding protein [Paenibacillus solanacearum]CAG7637000.1 Oligopeptide transport ATP-binding protein OppF [Paenibacillus solanacearum]